MKTHLCGCKRSPHGSVTCELELVHAGVHVGHSGGKKFTWRHTIGVRPIRLSNLTDLPSGEAIAALALSMEELAIAQSLKMIHGERRAAQMYVERGGHVRFHDDEPVLLWSTELTSPFAARQPA